MVALVAKVGGRAFGGWESVAVSTTIESLAGTFTLAISERWLGQPDPWPIREEDPISIEIGDHSVISGWVDSRSISIDATTRSLQIQGKDRAAALVENDAIPKHWTIRAGIDPVTAIRNLSDPFGIGVSVGLGLQFPKLQNAIAISPGDSPWSVISKILSQIGALMVSDGSGGAVIVRSGTARAHDRLILGGNIKRIETAFAASERFRRYVLLSQTPSTDATHGKACVIRGEATDPAVSRADRVKIVRPEKAITRDFARTRITWEAQIRAAKADSASITVRGWAQSDGSLWRPNLVVDVQAPDAGISGAMLITQVDYSLDGGGEVAALKLMRPDAFSPEPVKAKVSGDGGLWKELRKGAKRT